jgi:spermidine synthase
LKLLTKEDDGERCVTIIEHRYDGSRLYYNDGALYTHVDNLGANLLQYIHGMDVELRGVDDVLMLGTAGGALATQLSRRGVAVTAIDNWAKAFEIARRWFHLPDDVVCVHADALDFLRSTSERWSAIAVDLFRGVDIPQAVLTGEIAGLLVGALKPQGLIVWNVADHPASPTVEWIAKALAAEGLAPELVCVMDGDVGNTLVVCRMGAETGLPPIFPDRS